MKTLFQLKSEIEKLQEYKTQQEASIENNKINETEVLNWKNELARIKNLSEERETKLISEVDSKLNLITKLETELEEQKTKNNVSFEHMGSLKISKIINLKYEKYFSSQFASIQSMKHQKTHLCIINFY